MDKENPSDKNPTAPNLKELEINDEFSKLPYNNPPNQPYPAGYGVQSPHNVYAPSYPTSTSQMNQQNTTYPVPQLYSPIFTNAVYPSPNQYPQTAYAASHSYNYSVKKTQQLTQHQVTSLPKLEPIHDKEHGNPTVIPAKVFNPVVEAQTIADSLTYGSTNMEIITDILCNRSLQQRFVIADEYKKNNGELIFAFQVKTSGRFKDLMASLMTPIEVLTLQDLEKAINRNDFNIVTEIICTLKNNELTKLKSAYQKMYSKTLESGLEKKSFGNCKELLLEICKCDREESGTLVDMKAEVDARNLHDSKDVDYSCFMEIFTKRSFEQIKLICEVYEKLFSQSIEKKIKKIFSSADKEGYLVISSFVLDKHEYYAKRLYQSMKGIGTNDEQLIRIIVVRSEIDLKDIKEAFQRIYKETLKEWIEDDTSGYYRTGLVTLIGE